MSANSFPKSKNKNLNVSVLYFIPTQFILASRKHVAIREKRPSNSMIYLSRDFRQVDSLAIKNVYYNLYKPRTFLDLRYVAKYAKLEENSDLQSAYGCL